MREHEQPKVRTKKSDLTKLAKPPKKSRVKSAAVDVKESGRPPYMTRGEDRDGRLVDYTRHEPCGGKGCVQCGGMGFTKQYVAL